MCGVIPAAVAEARPNEVRRRPGENRMSRIFRARCRAAKASAAEICVSAAAMVSWLDFGSVLERDKSILSLVVCVFF